MNAQSRSIEEILVREGIPYRIIGGHKFYERKEIKDIISYLRLIQNTSDNLSLQRIINEPRLIAEVLFYPKGKPRLLTGLLFYLKRLCKAE